MSIIAKIVRLPQKMKFRLQISLFSFSKTPFRAWEFVYADVLLTRVFPNCAQMS